MNDDDISIDNLIFLFKRLIDLVNETKEEDEKIEIKENEIRYAVATYLLTERIGHKINTMLINERNEDLERYADFLQDGDIDEN